MWELGGADWWPASTGRMKLICLSHVSVNPPTEVTHLDWKMTTTNCQQQTWQKDRDKLQKKADYEYGIYFKR